ncbi:MAG: YtxH domain-containing protein [Bacteroidia bacterium]
MEKETQRGQIMIAVLAGAAIGGILGVLFAPDKGTETRKKLFGDMNMFSGNEEEQDEKETGHETESRPVVGQNAM